MRQSVTFKRKQTVYEFKPFVYAYIPGAIVKKGTQPFNDEPSGFTFND